MAPCTLRCWPHWQRAAPSQRGMEVELPAQGRAKASICRSRRGDKPAFLGKEGWRAEMDGAGAADLKAVGSQLLCSLPLPILWDLACRAGQAVRGHKDSAATLLSLGATGTPSHGGPQRGLSAPLLTWSITQLWGTSLQADLHTAPACDRSALHAAQPRRGRWAGTTRRSYPEQTPTGCRARGGWEAPGGTTRDSSR